MQVNSKSNYFYIFILVVLLLGVGYFVYKNQESNKPFQVLTPTGYPEKTTVSLYKSFPPNFPKELILGDEQIDYSGTVSSPNFDNKVRVTYVSQKSSKEIIDTYTSVASANGWTIATNSVSQNIGVLKATKGEKTLIISAVPGTSGVKVTIQYE